MAYKIKLAHKAQHDIKKAKEWYNRQNKELGNTFIANIKIQIEMLADSTVEYRKVYENVRKAAVKKFPFSIYFIQDSDAFTIDIIAVLHNKQDIFDQLSRRQ